MNTKTNVKGLQLLLLNLTKGKDKLIKEEEKKRLIIRQTQRKLLTLKTSLY